MHEYWLTFRISPGDVADQRLASLTETVARISVMWQLDTLSFIRFHSVLSRDAIAAEIRAAIDPATDIVLLGSPETAATLMLGASNDDEFSDILNTRHRRHRRPPPRR